MTHCRGMVHSMAIFYAMPRPGQDKLKTAFVHEPGFMKTIVVNIKGMRRTHEGAPLMEVHYVATTA